MHTAAAGGVNGSMSSGSVFRVWASCCAHVGTDLRVGRRESLTEAIRQSEGSGPGPGFAWDIALCLGDFSGNQRTPDDAEGAELVRQFGAARKHRREQFYTIAGNHDATGPGEERQWWFRTWVDPEGLEPWRSRVSRSQLPFPIDGTWERYRFRAGNLLFLMMSDRNDLDPPIGRGPVGGYPAGAVTDETFAWWREQVEANPDSIIVSAHHHVLRETTVASGPWEGMKKAADGEWTGNYHGYFPDEAPQGASYLYFVGERPDAGAFEGYLAEHPGAIDFWLGGHTHTNPDDRTGGRSHVERKWGVNFLNVAALTRHHVGPMPSTPMSRLLTFTEGSPDVSIECYLHTADHAPVGWYEPARRLVRCRHPFRGPS
jgi:hypothetical protein